MYREVPVRTIQQRPLFYSYEYSYCTSSRPASAPYEYEYGTVSILVWGVQRVKAAAIMNYWRAAAFLASLGSDGPGSGSGVAEPAVPDSRLLEYRTLDGIDIDMDALD